MKVYLVLGLMTLSLSAHAGLVCKGTGTYLKDHSLKSIRIQVEDSMPAQSGIELDIEGQRSRVDVYPSRSPEGKVYEIESFRLFVSSDPSKASNFVFYTSEGYQLVAPNLRCVPSREIF